MNGVPHRGVLVLTPVPMNASLFGSRVFAEVITGKDFTVTSSRPKTQCQVSLPGREREV